MRNNSKIHSNVLQEYQVWNSDARQLVKNLEHTIFEFSSLLSKPFDKENQEPKVKAKAVKVAHHVLQEQQKRKGSCETRRELIRIGICNLMERGIDEARISRCSSKTAKKPKSSDRIRYSSLSKSAKKKKIKHVN